MRPSFRIKSKSLPFFRQRLYNKISTKFKQQKWQQFLERELQLNLAIRQLSKAEFDISNQNQHKYSVRQNFQIKKEIIKCLEEEDIQNGLIKLQTLRIRMKEFNQEKGVSAMITFLDCRKLIKAEIKNGKEEIIIARIKAKLADTIFDNQSFMVKIKTMSILSILLLRFHGILMASQQRSMIFKTIELKKKKMLCIDQKQDRQYVFQCLIYIISQLYKIIYLLKLDQQTLLGYYNQLHAYSQIFIQKRQTNTLIQIQELLKILSDMKPSINDLNIYEDSKIKRQLAFQHIVEEIVEKEQKSQKKIELDQRLSTSSFRKSLEISMHSSGKLNKSNKLKIDNNPRRLTLKRPNLQKLSHLSSKKDQPEIITILASKGIHYKIILPILQKFYTLSVSLTFRNGFSLIDLDLTLSTQFTLIQKYQLKGICNALQKMTADGMGKLLQKIFLRVFGSTAQFSQIHNLIIDERFVPGEYEPLVFGLIRGKAVIKEYMRNNFQQEYITSKKIIYPQVTVSQLNDYLAREFMDEEGKRLKNTFEKRKGIFHRDQPLARLPQMLYLKFLVKKQIGNHRQYFYFNAYYCECFKGLDVFCFRKQSQPPELSPFIHKMNQISKQAYERHALIQRPKAIAELLLLHNKQNQYSQKITVYRVDQQLQLTNTNSKYDTIKMKLYNPLKRKTQTKIDQRAFEVIRTRNNQYSLFIKQDHGQYVRYSNSKHILNIPKEMIGEELRIEKKRVRMYNTISILWKSQTGTNSIKASIKKGVLVASKQVLTLQLCRHVILKKSQGFIMVIEYLCPSKEYLYELVLSPITRYYVFLQQKMDNLHWNQIDWANMHLKDSPLLLYKGGRREISEANYFYSCVRQHFPRTKSEVRVLQQDHGIS